jgi:hypothetical protein
MKISPRRSICSKFVYYGWLDYRLANWISDEFMNVINASDIHYMIYVNMRR